MCYKCGRISTPEKRKEISKYGHNLCAWSINQYVTHRININTVVNIQSLIIYANVVILKNLNLHCVEHVMIKTEKTTQTYHHINN